MAGCLPLFPQWRGGGREALARERSGCQGRNDPRQPFRVEASGLAVCPLRPLPLPRAPRLLNRLRLWGGGEWAGRDHSYAQSGSLLAPQPPGSSPAVGGALLPSRAGLLARALRRRCACGPLRGRDGQGRACGHLPFLSRTLPPRRELCARARFPHPRPSSRSGRSRAYPFTVSSVAARAATPVRGPPPPSLPPAWRRERPPFGDRCPFVSSVDASTTRPTGALPRGAGIPLWRPHLCGSQTLSAVRAALGGTSTRAPRQLGARPPRPALLGWPHR